MCAYSKLFRQKSPNDTLKDASAATFVFSDEPGIKDDPVTVIQGPDTAIFSENDQPYGSKYIFTVIID
jgi:hypothetical protein